MERDRFRTQQKMTLPREFYARNTVRVARDLLGKVVVKGETAGLIVETEAYLGGDDLASHSSAGITDRTRVIFGPPGHAYIYLSYGMHECLNVVAEPEGVPGCVLVRALEPVRGLDIMRARRPAAKSDRDLASGPGKLTRALGITLSDYGADLTDGGLRIEMPDRIQEFAIGVTPRIGISKCADLPLRFVVKNNKFVSRR
jgi:DNA-3-methyladenine glycosylase